jgi:hypothetical protein
MGRTTISLAGEVPMTAKILITLRDDAIIMPYYFRHDYNDSYTNFSPPHGHNNNKTYSNHAPATAPAQIPAPAHAYVNATPIHFAQAGTQPSNFSLIYQISVGPSRSTTTYATGPDEDAFNADIL